MQWQRTMERTVLHSFIKYTSVQYNDALCVLFVLEFTVPVLAHVSWVTFCNQSQTLQDPDSPLGSDESCLALLSEARSRQTQYNGLLTDARPATTQSYIYIHKTEENGETSHTFCYCLEMDRWKELQTERGEGAAPMPDPPGSYLTSYAEKVHFGTAR